MKPVEPGYTTTEFWLTLLTTFGAALTLLFHKDFSSSVPIWAGSASAIATGLYAIGRSLRKGANATANATVLAAPSAPSAVGSANPALTAWAASMPKVTP